MGLPQNREPTNWLLSYWLPLTNTPLGDATGSVDSCIDSLSFMTLTHAPVSDIPPAGIQNDIPCFEGRALNTSPGAQYITQRVLDA